MKNLLSAVAVLAIALGVACYSKTTNTNENTNILQPTPVTTPTPSPSPTATPGSGDNAVTSFGIFCYGFGAQPGQAEPNHSACELPPGYPAIAVTASPKNSSGVDVPNPGLNITWSATVSPANSALVTVDQNIKFNVTVAPANPRVDSTVVLTATYVDPTGKTHVATKTATIKQ